MTDRFSHPAEGEKPAVLLEDHLTDVAERTTLLVPEAASTPFGSSLYKLCWRLGYIHDAGKLTTWFQTHIHDGRPSGPSHHSPLGALLAFHVLQAANHSSEECLSGFVAVAKHHGRLPDTAEYVFDSTAWNHRNEMENQQREAIIQQVENIDDNVNGLAEQIVREASDGETTWAEFVDAVLSKELFDHVAAQVSRHGLKPDSSSVSSEFYQCVLQLWSTLVLADKTSAANAPLSGFDHEKPERETLSRFIDTLSDGAVPKKEAELNRHRRSAREDVLETVDKLVANDGQLATLTLPTGMGKTLTGLDAALSIREKTGRERTIYALPFTSIIDQVVEEVSEIFETDGTDSLLTVHHYLEDTIVSLEDATDDVDDQTDEHAHIEEMLGESWRSGITVTTFVQLFESLAGPKNTQSMKLPALYNSVLILDEPQSLPHDWWPLVERLVEILTTEYNAVVIAMTATQPKLFDTDTRELVDQPQEYFKIAERTEYVLDGSFETFPDTDDGPLEYDEAARTLLEAAEPDEDVLAICNTIDSAIALTESIRSRCSHVNVGLALEELLVNPNIEDVTGSMLANNVDEHVGDAAVIHLTTRIRPRDREVLIIAIKELTKRNLPVYVISTQLIEAGVDVSFDRVFRDIAPIDSIVQAAGRCNRSFARERGTVTLWWLGVPDQQTDTPAEAVYELWGESLLSVTKGVFDWLQNEDATRIEEPRVAWDGVREYYHRLEDRGVGRREYVSLLEKGLAESLGKLSLIDQRLAIEVVVCRTQAERDQVEAIKDAWSEFDFETVNNYLRNLRPSQVSIPIYRTDSEEAKKIADLNRIHDETNIRFIDTTTKQYEDFFDPNTGFVVPESTVERRFL